MADFDLAFALTMSFEGAASHDPADKGGSTGKGGLTQEAYDSFRIDQGLLMRPVSEATDDERQAIAWERYWLPAKCAELLAPASLVHFDASYNAGPLHAVMILQAVLGVKIDGDFGAVTKGEADLRHPEMLAHDLVTARRGYHLKAVVDDHTQARFLAGWIARCDDLSEFIARSRVVG